MSVTERDRLIKLEGEVERLKKDKQDQADEITAINEALYGKGPNDKNSISAQLLGLQNDRAIRIWFVSIASGIGIAVVSGALMKLLEHHP